MENVRSNALDTNIFFGSTLLSKDALYAVQDTDLPGISVNHINQNTSVGNINLQGDIAEYTPVKVSLIMDEKLLIWKEIIALMQKYHIPGTNQCEPVVGDSWLELRDNRNNYLFKIELKNTYIKTVSAMKYSTTSENIYLTLDIEIVYDYFEVV